MERISAMFMAICLTVLCPGCTAKPGDAGVKSRKVADQRLATYTPIRRLSYRNACGGEGPLTLCVERVTLSDSAALVEIRIRNMSQETYVQGTAGAASVFLADEAGIRLAWSSADLLEYPGQEERIVRFRMEGNLGGEPHAVMLNNIRRKSVQDAGHGFSVVATLGE